MLTDSEYTVKIDKFRYHEAEKAKIFWNAKMKNDYEISKSGSSKVIRKNYHSVKYNTDFVTENEAVKLFMFFRIEGKNELFKLDVYDCLFRKKKLKISDKRKLVIESCHPKETVIRKSNQAWEIDGLECENILKFWGFKK